MLPIDLHTHTMASGHGTTDTVADLAKNAGRKGLAALGISDHGPATPGSCSESYFRGLPMAPRRRAGVTVFYGAEANILDTDGRLDLSDDTLSGLDFCIAGIHPQTFRSPAYHRCSFWNSRQVTEDGASATRSNTQAYINAMMNPYVNIIAHPDDPHYPIDCEKLVDAAVKYHVFLEINNSSLAPGSFRGDGRAVMRKIAELCLQRRHPILLSSDSHGAKGVGEAPFAEALAKEADIPGELILNLYPAEELLALLNRRNDFRHQF